MEKAVILVSGGINSAVAAAVAREQYEPALLHVGWGHRSAERERACFEQIATHFDVDQVMVADLPCLAMFGGNARVNRRLAIEDAAALDGTTPATFAACVLPTILSTAAAWAGAIKASKIILGISEDHGVSGPAISELYPDYRLEFVQTFNLMLRYATRANRKITVEAPLLDLTRGEVVALGQRLGVPFEKTWSCYADNETPCGRCLPCATRSAGFVAGRLADPLLSNEPAAASS